MAVLQGSVSFPGIDPGAVIGADYTLGHGVSPGICNLRVAAGTTLRANVGDLVFRFGEVKLRFADCVLQSGALRLGRGGQVWNLRIVDRRWKWQYGTVSGRYNIRGEDGRIDRRLPQKTPQQLAALLLEAMNESGFSVSALPAKARPEVVWDHANPARELAELCEALGCRVVLGTDNKVRIRRLGQGQRLPDGGLAMNAGLGVQRTIPPDEIRLVYGPTVYQSRLTLEAVGEDTDGSIRPIDELEYKPEDGWKHGAASAENDLADKTVFRMYRVEGQASGGLQFPTLDRPKVESLDQYVLRDRLAEMSEGTEGVKRRRPPVVCGTYYDERTDAEGNTPPNTFYRYGFTLDPERHLVIFDRPVYRIDEDGYYNAAQLFLTTSYHLRYGRGDVLARKYTPRRLGGRRHNTGPRVERRPEIFAIARAVYRGERSVARVDTNYDQAVREANEYLDALQRQYAEVDQTADVQYAGLVDISPDGAVQQVTWRVGDGGPATTRASRNAEGNIYAPSYAEKRRWERAERLRDAERRRRKVATASRTTVIP